MLWELDPASGSVMAKAILSSPLAKPGSHALLLLLGAEVGDDGGADGGGDHEEEQRAAVRGQLLEDDGQFADPHAAAAVLLGNVDPEEAGRGHSFHSSSVRPPARAFSAK